MRTAHYIIIFLFLITCNKNVFGGTPPGQDPTLDNDSSVSIIPFNRAGNLILIQGKADTLEGNFILDTGAPGLVLNITYFRHYSSSGSEERSGITGAVTTALQTHVKDFSFGGQHFENADADLISLGHIEDRRGVKILGLIGVSFLKQSEMMIDYEKSIIYLRQTKKNDTYKNKMLANTSDFSTVPIEVVENKIVATTRMGTRKMKFFIDTGAESNVLDSRLPNKVFENVIISRRTSVIGAGNKKMDALYGDLKNMKIGNQDITSLPVLITNLENACISPLCCIDGMLGFDFLSLHKIGFNFVKEEMYIWK